MAVVALGIVFFIGNLVDGVGVWDFLPLIAIACGRFAIEQVRRNQDAVSGWVRRPDLPR